MCCAVLEMPELVVVLPFNNAVHMDGSDGGESVLVRCLLLHVMVMVVGSKSQEECRWFSA